MRLEPRNIIRKPIVTERTTALKQKANQVVFEVDRRAKKPEIKNAIETLFNVKVEALNTMVVRGKVKRMGRYEGKRSNWKKAIATLKDGDNIEIFEGV